jgi:hypothetical protein
VSNKSITAEVPVSHSAGNPLPGDHGLRALIEKIVREALAGLTVNAVATPSAAANPAQTKLPAVTRTAGAKSESASHAFTGSVLTAEHAEGFPRDVSVSIHAKTVITPAARDILRTRHVKVIRGGFVRHHLPQGGVIAVADVDGLRRCAVIARQLAAQGFGEIRGMGWNDLIERVAKGSTPAFVTANLPQQTVWDLCHNQNMRAAQVSDFQEATEVQQAMQPQVWVIDMRRQSLSTAIGLIQHCLRIQDDATLALGGNL